MADVLSVSCPDCGAPPEVACYVSGGSGGFEGGDTHANRVDRAALETGYCKLCGRKLHRLNGRRWHADRSDTCPPLPDPHLDWNAYALRLQDGVSPGDPGDDNWMSEDEHNAKLNAAIDQLHGPGAAAALDAAIADGSIFGDDQEPEPAVCPECNQGKHVNCDGTAYDKLNDTTHRCPCRHIEGTP